MEKKIRQIFLLAIIVSAFGCSGGRPGYPVLKADAAVNGFITETRPFEIGSEKYQADYGTIRVPENRCDSTSRLIDTPFLRIRSQSKSPAEPVFGFAGGPGQSNMSWDRGKVLTFLPRHDFVLVGYRGVDGSTVLDCPEVTKAFKEAGDPLSEESMERVGRAWMESAEGLRAEGVDLDGYTMLEVIEDNESVRKALGYERINLLSESYGTCVAYLYALEHPGSIFRSAMISVNPPGHFVWEPAVTDAQLKQYSTLRSGDSLMSKKCPDLYAAMRKVSNAMPRRWLLFPISTGKVKVVSFALLFQRNTAAMVFDAYVAAVHGDPSGLALMSMAYDFVVPSMMNWGDLASKAVSADFDSTRNYSKDMDPADLPLGSPMSKILWGPLSYGRWPTALLPGEFRKVRQCDVQTLLLSGSVDFSTPPEFAAKEMLPYLTNGKQIILSECGHVNDMWYANTQNMRLILTSFFDTGMPNTSLNSYIPMYFSVAWGFPTIAKLALAAIVLVGISLAGVFVWLIRRHRRRRLLSIPRIPGR